VAGRAIQYDIYLDGVQALDLPMAVLRDLTNLLLEGAARATRLAAEGRSQARGSAPAWLGDAADIRVVGFRAGSLSLDVTARPLADIAPEIFAQQSLFPVRGAQDTAVDLLMDALDDALRGRRDSDRLDVGLLQLFAETRSLFQRGPSRLRMSRADGKALELDASTARAFQSLADATPRAQVTRIAGVLDSLTMSGKTFLLRLDDGSSLRGLAGSVSLDQLKVLLGSRVVVEGTVAFRSSGRAQRIEIDYVAPAEGRDIVWAAAPRGDVGPIPVADGDLASLFGQWPGEESDAELFAALEEMS
jgi:hypothetical protein